jgi:hypothetical protein
MHDRLREAINDNVEAAALLGRAGAHPKNDAKLS